MAKAKRKQTKHKSAPQRAKKQAPATRTEKALRSFSPMYPMDFLYQQGNQFYYSAYCCDEEDPHLGIIVSDTRIPEQDLGCGASPYVPGQIIDVGHYGSTSSQEISAIPNGFPACLWASSTIGTQAFANRDLPSHLAALSDLSRKIDLARIAGPVQVNCDPLKTWYFTLVRISYTCFLLSGLHLTINLYVLNECSDTLGRWERDPTPLGVESCLQSNISLTEEGSGEIYLLKLLPENDIAPNAWVLAVNRGA